MRIFEPLKIKGVRLRNRLVMAPFETNWATREGYLTPRQRDFYLRVARGGVGLIILEAASVNPRTKYTPYGLGIYDDSFIPTLRELTDGIRGEGVASIFQVADKENLQDRRKPADFTRGEIKEIVGYFVAASRRTRRAGFDGVEYHMCHLYTLADFLSRRANRRRDEYGGSVERRMRIALEVVEGARKETGDDFLIACRFNGDDFVTGGNTLKQSREIARRFEAAGVDILDISVGGRVDDAPAGAWNSYSAERCVPPAQYPDATNVELAAAIKEEVKVPVITAGKLGTPELAERVLSGGKADLVGLGRVIFADPEFPLKVREGRREDIIYCTWCNICHRLYFEEKPVTCPLWENKPGRA